MKYYIDTEFIESGPKKPIQLISLGIVSEDGRELYCVSSEFNPEDASPWVQDNVLDSISEEDYKSAMSLESIGHAVAEFVLQCLPNKPEFWGYYSDYDWVTFCQIFGTMMNLPQDFPMYCLDIKQVCIEKGNPKLPEQGKGEHNALADARWNKTALDFLLNL